MKYSIITVNYNNKEGLRKTIESVIHQTFRDFEYIVIDGGSTDGSADVLKEYDKDISYWVSEPDGGIYQGMNKGIARATGDYLNFMNSGDCFYDENVLQKIADQNLDADMIIGRDYWYNPKTKKDFATILPLRLEMFTFYKGSLPHQSTFFKKSLFNQYQYDETLKVVSDWKFYIQKIVGEGCTVKFFDGVICRKDLDDGVGYTFAEKADKEKKAFIAQYLPIGIQKHYDILTRFDTSTFYKLIVICEKPKTLRYLTLAIKIIYRIFNFSQKK